MRGVDIWLHTWLIVALDGGKKPHVPIGYVTGWIPEPVWTCLQNKKSLSFPRMKPQPCSLWSDTLLTELLWLMIETLMLMILIRKLNHCKQYNIYRVRILFISGTPHRFNSDQLPEDTSTVNAWNIFIWNVPQTLNCVQHNYSSLIQPLQTIRESRQAIHKSRSSSLSPPYPIAFEVIELVKFSLK